MLMLFRLQRTEEPYPFWFHLKTNQFTFTYFIRYELQPPFLQPPPILTTSSQPTKPKLHLCRHCNLHRPRITHKPSSQRAACKVLPKPVIYILDLCEKSKGREEETITHTHIHLPTFPPIFSCFNISSTASLKILFSQRKAFFPLQI